MCQLFAISNVAGITPAKLERLAVVTRRAMSSQKDGFSFAMCGAGNQPYLQRYVEPNLFSGFNPPTHLMEKIFGQSLWASSGKMAKTPKGPMIIHGRTATNEVSLTNSHPFVVEKWVIAHNGVVTPKTGVAQLPRVSTNDSEYVANILALKGANAMVEYIWGYMAVVAISPDKSLVVFKDARASLKVAEGVIAGVPRLLFGTTDSILSAAGRVLELALTPVDIPSFLKITIPETGELSVEALVEWQSAPAVVDRFPGGFTGHITRPSFQDQYKELQGSVEGLDADVPPSSFVDDPEEDPNSPFYVQDGLMTSPYRPRYQ